MADSAGGSGWDGDGDGIEATCAVCLETLEAPDEGGSGCERAVMPCCEREGRDGHLAPKTLSHLYHFSYTEV